jgi:hypothetical protein
MANAYGYGALRTGSKAMGLGLAGVGFAWALASGGCSSDESPVSAADSGPDSFGSIVVDSGSDRALAQETGGDSGPDLRSPCQAQRDFIVACKGEFLCGDEGFDAWCAESDRKVDSDARRRAIVACYTADRCTTSIRRDCEYGHYAAETPTAAQQQLVAHYCASCEPDDVSGCTRRATRYAGASSLTDIFLAAWEFNDTLVGEIDQRCVRKPDGGTDASPDGAVDGATDAAGGGDGASDAGDAGTDSLDPKAACIKAFGQCAGDIYLSALPDCAN